MRERLERLLGAARAARSGSSPSTPPAAASSAARPSGSATARTSRSTTRPTRSGSSSDCLEELERDPKRFAPRGIHAQISNAKNQLVGPDEYARASRPSTTRRSPTSTSLYQRRLFASNAVDFDDLLMLTVDVLERFPEARERWPKAFRYVLVDEYQDTNHAQYRLLQLLAEQHRNLCAVGDPDQSIYALPRRRHPQHPRVRARLPRRAQRSRSSRTTARRTTILGAANARHLAQPRAQGEAPLVGARRGRAGARGRGRGRARRGALRRGRDRGRSSRRASTATRSRSSTGRTRSRACSRTSSSGRGSRYQVIGGPRFYERAEIKDVVAYLQVIDNPYDAVSLARIANRPRRGDRRHVARAAADARRRARRSRSGRRSAAPRRPASRAAPLRRRCTRCTTLMQSLQAGALELEVPELRRARARAQRLPRGARGRADDRGARAGSRTSRSSSASRGSSSRRRAGADALVVPAGDLALLRPGRAARRGATLVTLMTLHNAKGLEFRAVFVIGMEEGIFPHSRSIEEQGIEEERRLCYVGMTRAKERLTLMHALVAVAVRARAATTCPRASSTSCRRRASSASGCGRRRGRATARRSSREVAPRADVPDLSTGDTVRHGTLGEGVVTRIEPGGVVTVRFADEHRAAADARVRAVGEDRLSVEVRPCRDLDEFREALGGIGQYFGWSPDAESSRAVLADLAARAHARDPARRRARRRGGRVPVRAVRPGRPRAAPAAHRRRRPADAPAPRRAERDDAAPSSTTCTSAASRRGPLGVRGDDLRPLRLRASASLDERGRRPARARRFAAPVEPRGRVRLVDPTRRSSASRRCGSASRARTPGHVRAHAGVVGDARARRPARAARRRRPAVRRRSTSRTAAPTATRSTGSTRHWDDGLLDGHAERRSRRSARPRRRRRAIWRYLLDIDWVAQFVRAWLLPADHPLVPARRAALLRCADRRRAVGAARRRRRGAPRAHVRRRRRAVLDVADELCPWNEGRWRVGAGRRRADRRRAGPRARRQRRSARRTSAA